MPIDTCEGCPLFTKAQGFCPDKHVPDPEFVIVGEAPGKNELIRKEPFVGDAGFVLKNWLMRAVPTLQVASERGKISYVNILHCLPPETQGRPYPRGLEKEQAEAHCTQYRNLGTAKTVILCGESPQRYYFREELDAEDLSDRRLGHDVKGVMGRIGRVYERDGKRWIFAPHPAYILRQPALVQHGQMALQIAANTERLAEIDYISWDHAMGAIQ